VSLFVLDSVVIIIYFPLLPLDFYVKVDRVHPDMAVRKIRENNDVDESCFDAICEVASAGCYHGND